MGRTDRRTDTREGVREFGMGRMGGQTDGRMDVMEGVRGLGWDRRTDSQRHKGGEQRVSVGVDRWTDRQTDRLTDP